MLGMKYMPNLRGCVVIAADVAGIGNCADQASLKIPPFEKGGLGGICGVDGDHEPPEIPPRPPFFKGEKPRFGAVKKALM
jgi:hypothetical protein